jgi:hypothetical protein
MIILRWCYDYSGIILLLRWDGVMIILRLFNSNGGEGSLIQIPATCRPNYMLSV